MGRRLNLTSKEKAGLVRDFLRAIDSTDVFSKLSFATDVRPRDNQNAIVIFKPIAYSKMISLIENFSEEVAWHGVGYRSEAEEKNEYFITDIVVYPQKVSGTSVEMNEVEYGKWLMQNSDDDRFNNLRMQGHSHVNMSVTPSATDLSHQKEILEMLDDDSFYIFMIWNKSFQRNIIIFDKKKNYIFDNADVEIRVGETDLNLDEFVSEAKKIVKSERDFCEDVFAIRCTSAKIGAGWSGASFAKRKPVVPYVEGDA